MRNRLRMLLVLAGLAFGGAAPLLAQTWIADLRAAPQRHVNREVTIEGQIVAVAPNPPGTTRGTYTVVDDSDPNGMAVRTRELPAPGLEVRVTGTLIQDPTTATFLIDEITRGPAGRPGWLLPALIAAAVLVLVLVVLLLRTLFAPRQSTPAAVAPTVRPVPPPAAESAPAGGGWTAPPRTARPASDATEVVRPAADATELFRPLGATLRVTKGPDTGKEFPLGKPVTLIGRAGQRPNDITLSDTAVSRDQARIVYNEQGKSFTLINESQTNPTRVDGVPVDARELRNGAVIEFGKTTVTMVLG